MQNSPISNIKPKVVEEPKVEVEPEVEIPEFDEDEGDSEEEIDEVEEIPTKEEITPPQASNKVSKEEHEREQQILMEIEMLQNNGRFRAELLHQLQEINKALVVVAGVLVDLSGDKK